MKMMMFDIDFLLLFFLCQEIPSKDTSIKVDNIYLPKADNGKLSEPKGLEIDGRKVEVIYELSKESKYYCLDMMMNK